MVPPHEHYQRFCVPCFISHLIFLSPKQFPSGVMCNVDSCSTGGKSSGYCNYPRKWMASVPWASFKSTQTVSLPFSHVLVPEERPFIDRTDRHIELLTLSAPPAIGHIKRYGDIEDGEGHVSLVDVRATFLSIGSQFSAYLALEEAWACGLCRWRRVLASSLDCRSLICNSCLYYLDILYFSLEVTCRRPPDDPFGGLSP
jgi:hypothetical protein